MTVLHTGLLAHAYLVVAQDEQPVDMARLIQRDLNRPWLELSASCCQWVQFSDIPLVDMGINFPAYIGVSLLHSLANADLARVDYVNTPRGHILTMLFVPPMWLLTGRSIQRLHLHLRRRRRVVSGRLIRAVISLAFLLVPFAILCLALGTAGLFLSQPYTSFRTICLGIWQSYLVALAAERLGLWPFRQTPTVHPVDPARPLSPTPQSPSQPTPGYRAPHCDG